MTHRVFSYGTLRQENVQRALFGGPVPTAPDSLPGWRLDWLVITDPEVVRTSGSDRHPVLRPGEPTDSVPGACLEVDDAGLAAVDDYEVDDYVRREAVLASGVRAWVYVAADDAPAVRADGGAEPAPQVNALALNVAIPERLQWTDTRRGEEYLLTTLTVRRLPDGGLAAKAYGRPTAGGRGTYVSFPVREDPAITGLIARAARRAAELWADTAAP